MTPRKDLASTGYFDQYGPLQRYKHEVLSYYLGGWFPKIADRGNRILYIETHAGAGVHRAGEKGSPLIALGTLLGHEQRDRVLRKATFTFLFLEIEQVNLTTLEEALREYSLPAEVRVVSKCTDYKEAVTHILEELQEVGSRLTPAFTFIDPFGMDIPVDLVRRLLAQPSGEVLVTFMAQAVARAMGDPTKIPTLNRLYGSDCWVEFREADFEQRKEAAIALYRRVVGADWCSSLRMKGATDYALMHFTNHTEGRALMKRAIWKMEPSGSYRVLSSDDLDQLLLVEPEPRLEILAEQLRKRWGGKSASHMELVEWNLDTDFLDRHLNEVLRRGRDAGWIRTEHKRRFGPSMKHPIHVEGL